MKTIVVLYASNRGSTRKVVKRLAEMVEYPFDCFDVRDLTEGNSLHQYKSFIFCSPTYGNEELPLDMERFIVRFNLDMSQRQYAICELGNYYGYDSEFGAMKIIRYHLEKLHGTELIKPLSMDSLPQKDWRAFAAWCGQLNALLGDAHE